MSILEKFVKEIFNIASRGDAREESYYFTLESLLKEYSQSTNKKKIHVTVLPKETEAGNPDFRVWDGKQHIVGYIEAKDPSKEHLDQIQSTEQLKRYRETFPNLILTNFFEYRLYRNGILVDTVSIGRPYAMFKLKTAPPVEKETEFFKLLENFFSFSLPKVYSAKALAVELAKRTRLLNDIVIQELRDEEEKGKGFILGFYEAFNNYLIANLTKEDFADLYSQTITYGLFAARTRAKNGFNRKLAYDSIPKTIGILRDVFKFISLEDLPKQMEVIIDDISEVLAVTDVYKILDQFFHEGKGKDPIIHFYETFLAEYDPKTREKRGVYYTPEPVVSYIVRSINIILKEQFGKTDGFASKSVTVLDPAAGTLTFLAEAAKFTVEEITSKYGDGILNSLIEERILNNFYAFELMMAPYAIGHLKMSFLLEELGYHLKEDQRFKLYLTNTLEMEELPETKLPGMSALSEESHLAGKVKKEQPILVVMGNPPYSVSSANRSKFMEGYVEKVPVNGQKRMRNSYIRGALDDYKDDVKNERNIQPLSDDYIKFIRFAHWKIDQAGSGLIGLITNNSYLSGLIHRGMRKKLLDSFDEIYIINLHGNSRIGEKTPDGGKDENVFDIQQGVAIALFVKEKKPEPIVYEPPAQKNLFEKERPKEEPPKHVCKVFYSDVWGLRNAKYEWLSNNDIKTIKWKKLKCEEPNYFFIEKDFAHQANYSQFISISNILENYSSGVKTHRDNFVVGFKKEELVQKMKAFTSTLPNELVAQSLLLKNTTSFNLSEARSVVKKMNWEEQIIPYSYRPFDNRLICYIPDLIDRPHYETMKNFLKNNLSMNLMRQYYENDFHHVFIANAISDVNYLTNAKGQYVFPLYLYPEKEKEKPKENPGGGVVMALFEPEADYHTRKPNIAPEIIEGLTKAFKKTLLPEEIFYYIYAVLYSNIYRVKYAEFLKIDFPRVPFTSDLNLFNQLAEIGKRLVDLHLVKSSELDSPIAKFQGKGSNKVERVTYEITAPVRARNDGKVYINKDQYFEGITPELWEYQIGGYQVLNKWLKDRKDRELSFEDIQHYYKIATSLSKTIELQSQIDYLYPSIEKTLINLISG